MENKEPRNRKTPLSDLGKINAQQRLFEGSRYVNREAVCGNASCENQVLTVSRLLLEGIDFDLVYTPLKHLGYKSALAALGGIYARSFVPKSLYYTIGISARFYFEDVRAFWDGVLAAAEEHRIEQVGLDLNSSLTGLSIGVCATGEQAFSIIGQFPRPQQHSLLCLTGNVGAAYMGLHVLEREKAAFNRIPAAEAGAYKQPDLSKYKYLLSQYLSPEINPDMPEQFRQDGLYPAAGYFITRGLADSVRQLCRDTGLGARIYLERIPIAAQTFEMAEELNIDAITAALNGGDDYKFLFVIPLDKHEAFRKEFPNLDVIGHLTAPESGAVLVTPEGAELPLRAPGWQDAPADDSPQE